jgi:hypothetical protein
MALSISVLKQAIIDEVNAEFGAPDDASKLSKFAQALATAIVEHIQANAAVTGTVTSGAGSGGSVVGTVG